MFTFLDSQPSSKAEPTLLPPIQPWLLHHFQPHNDPEKAAQIILLWAIVAESLETEQAGEKRQREVAQTCQPVQPQDTLSLQPPVGTGAQKEKGVRGTHGRDSVTCFREGLPVVGNRG